MKTPFDILRHTVFLQKDYTPVAHQHGLALFGVLVVFEERLEVGFAVAELGLLLVDFAVEFELLRVELLLSLLQVTEVDEQLLVVDVHVLDLALDLAEEKSNTQLSHNDLAVLNFRNVC